MVRAFHSSLETLVLPAEPAPIQSISSLNWPRLRELRLRGIRWTAPSTPIVSLFACMPHPQTLALELYEPEHVDARAVWPRGFSAAYPWAVLDYIHISHPDADDEIYAHLPPTLGGLALHSWPHLCVQAMNKMRYFPSELRWNFPPALPSTLLQILRRCRAPCLHTLELEYEADDPGADAEVLQYIAASFPRLRTLELHRYRKGHPTVPTAGIAYHLTPLADLTTIKLHLDFPGTPPPVFYPIDDRHRALDSGVEAHQATLESAAAVFANVLSPSLQEI